MQPRGRVNGIAIGPDGTAVAVGYSVLNRGVVPTIWVSQPAPA
jgi:hypothetical protein